MKNDDTEREEMTTKMTSNREVWKKKILYRRPQINCYMTSRTMITQHVSSVSTDFIVIKDNSHWNDNNIFTKFDPAGVKDYIIQPKAKFTKQLVYVTSTLN